MKNCRCGEPATANGRECPTHFRERLRSVRLDTSVTSTRTKNNYYDSSSVDDVWGHDSYDRMMEETHGLGYTRQGPDGLYRKDRKTGDPVRVTDKELDQVYLGGSTEEQG